MLRRTSHALALLASLLLLVACDNTPMDPDAAIDFDAAVLPDSGPADCAGRPADAPVTRSEIGMVYDAARERLVIYGGNTAASERCAVPPSVVVGEMWAFHLDCQSWEQLSPAGGPGNLVRHATVLDESRGRMLVFAGRSSSSSYFNAVWSFDLATDTWSEIATTGTAPSPTMEAVAQIDVDRDRLLVFGGGDPSAPLGFGGRNTFHSLDLATNEWTEITAAGAPSPRLYHASVIMGDELIIFGGTNQWGLPYLSDTHAFNLTTDTWREITTAAAPNARFGMELVADPDRGRVLMAFGHDDAALGNSNDVWALDPAAGTWTVVHVGDQFNSGPAGMCDFPADFTIIEPDSPERRYSVGVAQTATGSFFFGGKADCGYLNDVWRYDFGTDAWELVRASTSGEVCLRTGRTDCGSLCF